MERYKLDREFVEFDQMQSVLSDLGTLEREGLQGVNNVSVFVCTPAQGRPPTFLPKPIAYDESLFSYHKYKQEHRQFLSQNPPGTLIKLAPLPERCQSNICRYLTQRPLLTQQNDNNEYVPSQFANFIWNGDAKYEIENWGTLADAKYHKRGDGWASVSKKLAVHDTIFMVNDTSTAVHAGVYLGANLMIHKLTTNGLVWVSSLGDMMEPADRWDAVYIANNTAEVARKQEMEAM